MLSLWRDAWPLRRAASLAFLLLAFGPVPAAAQSALPSDPLNPAVTRAIPYVSAFEGYRSFRAGAVGDWRSLNDAVGTVGGHSGSLRDIQAPAPKAEAPTSSPPAVPRTPVEAAPLGGHVGPREKGSQ